MQETCVPRGTVAQQVKQVGYSRSHNMVSKYNSVKKVSPKTTAFK